MKHGFFCVLSAVAMLPALAAADTNHPPDLSGIWTFAIDLPPVALEKRGPDGKVLLKDIDRSAARPAGVPIPGALPFTPEPSYKPEFQAKVKYLIDNESKTDQVFYCGRPGVPRI